jgi:phage baseplate assembly protein gpV
MFSNLSKPDPNYDEGIVVQIDPKRKACKVKTITGQNLDYVQWTESVGNSSRGGDRVGPSMGDRVVILYGLGYPLIFGFLPKLQSEENTFPLHIDSGNSTVDTGDYSPGGTLAMGDTNKPGDILNGDRVISSEGGAQLGLLRAGTVFLRSSRLAEIFLSKWDDVVKVICRNWEHYTDVSSDIVKNFKGRVYRYIGYTNSFSEAKAEAYRYHQYFGDVAAAEALKTNYLAPPSPMPDISALLKKEQVTKPGSGEVMRHTFDIDGNEEIYITKDGKFTRRLASANQCTISYGDANTITINDPVIQLQRADGANIVMNSSGITMTYSGGQIKMNSSGVYHTYAGHFMNVTSAGVQLG